MTNDTESNTTILYNETLPYKWSDMVHVAASAVSQVVAITFLQEDPVKSQGGISKGSIAAAKVVLPISVAMELSEIIMTTLAESQAKHNEGTESE